MVNWTSVKLSDLMRQKTLRMDAKYWIQKALLKKKKKDAKDSSFRFGERFYGKKLLLLKRKKLEPGSNR